MKRLRRIAASLVLVAGTAWAGDHSVSLIFAGDVMLDDGPGRLIADGGDPLAAVAPLLADADYRIANLECSVSTRGASLPGKPYTFRADPRALRVMQGRFDAVAVSNNHSGDFGPDAFLDTIDHLRQAGLRSFGGGRNLRDAHAPLWLHKNGLRIAVLGYNEYKPRSFEAGASRPGVAWSEDSEMISDIRAARKAGAHIVIPFMHWGWENRHTPSLRQRMLARKMIDAGASLVVG
ncbi:MAG: CapA family protein, partial [Zoogloea sp.]|nr:CapA family protein [Zoogloea sp.]